MADQQFCLRWNNHQSTLISVFDTLLENGTLVDCTLAAEGQYLKAHKVVLSACSPYLETLLSQHYEKHPIVILKDVKFSELKSMMDYMYRGEVNISQDQLGTFLKAAESLQIKGLSDNGADGDARDVGSTPKAPPPRKANQPAPSSRPEPSRPDSPLTDGSMSPSSRKRRRVRRSSQDDGDSHLDSNSCDLPNQAQSTPVPNIPATSSITTTPIVKPAIVKPEQTDVNRIDSNSLPPEALKKEIEPISEPLLEPKTEYLEDVNNEDSVEDLTLDDDDDMEGMDISNMSNMSNMSRPGPSHGNDISNQGFAPWQLGANQSGTDEVFMAAQEAVNQHRDSQDPKYMCDRCGAGLTAEHLRRIHIQFHCISGPAKSGSKRSPGDPWNCYICNKVIKTDKMMRRHLIRECNMQPKFMCQMCDLTFTREHLYQKHMSNAHPQIMEVLDELTRVQCSQLGSGNEELETGNEELETGNEEMETGNEEMETSNEELETGNEEMETGNEEMETENGLQTGNTELETGYEELETADEDLEKGNEEYQLATDDQDQVIPGNEEGNLEDEYGDLFEEQFNEAQLDLENEGNQLESSIGNIPDAERIICLSDMNTNDDHIMPQNKTRGQEQDQEETETEDVILIDLTESDEETNDRPQTEGEINSIGVHIGNKNMESKDTYRVAQNKENSNEIGKKQSRKKSKKKKHHRHSSNKSDKLPKFNFDFLKPVKYQKPNKNGDRNLKKVKTRKEEKRRKHERKLKESGSRKKSQIGQEENVDEEQARQSNVCELTDIPASGMEHSNESVVPEIKFSLDQWLESMADTLVGGAQDPSVLTRWSGERRTHQC